MPAAPREDVADHRPLHLGLGDHGLELDLREWVNSGLMSFFFFVVGLEARREFDLGELRERRRLALGLLALAGVRSPAVRAFLLTVLVVDDLVALTIIAVVYTDDVAVPALLVAVGLLGVVRAARIRSGAVYLVLGVATWVALHESGVDPVTAGLARAASSPITLGIIAAYVLGKPVGIAGMSWLVTTLSRGRLQAPVGWAAVLGGGTIAGVGFTVSLLISTLAFTGDDLESAKIGVLAAAVIAYGLSWLVFRGAARLPESALLGSSPVIVDLADPVDDAVDHLRGPADAPVTVVEYGHFECPYCGQAESVVRELLVERVNGRRHHGSYDIGSLTAEVTAALSRAG